MMIDPSVRGKQVYIKAYLYYSGTINIVNVNGKSSTLLDPGSRTLSVAQAYTIPEDAEKIALYKFISSTKAYLYEIRPEI